jgi:hypothetical protein
MRRQYSTPHLVYSYLFPCPTPSDPPDFQQHLIRNLITEVRIETHRFYGGLETIEAKYPGLNYAHTPHRRRLARFPHHARLFEAFDALGLTPYEIGELCKWEGTLWARQRYERDEGVKVEDTTGNEIKPWKPRKELKTSGHKRSASGDIKKRFVEDQEYIRDYTPRLPYSSPQPLPRSPILHSHLHRDYRPRSQPAAPPLTPTWSIMNPVSREVQQLTSSQEDQQPQQQQAPPSNVEQQTPLLPVSVTQAPLTPAESPPTPSPSTPTPQDLPEQQLPPRVVTTRLPTPAPTDVDELECIEDACQHKDDEMGPILEHSSMLGVAYVVEESMFSPIPSSPPSLAEDESSVSASP